MASPAYEAIRASGCLPSPDEAALNILRIARDPDATIQEIAAVVETDPATTARILKYVNSPFVGLAHKVGSVQKAVTLLGLRCVVSLALGYSLLSRNRSGRCSCFDYDGFWSDSLARAVTVRHLSTRLGLIPNETFTCGLLSKIGQLAMASVFPQEYTQVLTESAEDQNGLLLELERNTFQIDQHQLTAEMLDDWSLPAYFCEAVMAQEDPQAFDLTPGSRAKQLANLLYLCGMLSPVFANQDLHRKRLTFLMDAVDRVLIKPERFSETFQDIGREWQEMGVLFNVRTEADPPWERICQDAGSLIRRA